MKRLSRGGWILLTLGAITLLGGVGWAILSTPFSTPTPANPNGISPSTDTPASASQPPKGTASPTTDDSDETSTSPEADPSDPDERSAPTETSSGTDDPQPTPTDTDESTETPSSPPEQSERVGIVKQGRLALEIDGRQFSEETYELTRNEDGTYRLDSSGTFSVPVMVTDISFNYTQTIRLEPQWQPRGYTFDLKGPLNFGNRHVEAEFDDDLARITQGDATEPQTYQLERRRYAVIGMLASYTLLPKLLGENESVQLSTMVVSFRGEDGPGNDNLAIVPLTLARVGPDDIVDPSRGETLEVTRLTMTFNADSPEDATPPLDLYVRNDQFLALYGRFSQDSPPFRIYDLARFPDGFDTASP